MANPAPVRPLTRVMRAYEMALRQAYLAPLYRTMVSRLARATGSTQAFHEMDKIVSAMIAKPSNGVPTFLIQKHLDDMNGYHRGKVISTFRRALGIDIRPILNEVSIDNFMSLKVRENVNLIKTIPQRWHAALETHLRAELQTAPFDQQRLTKLVRDTYKSSGYNLRRIVRDQTSKTIGQLTEIRQQQAGVEEYQWLTSQDQRVRPSHVANSGMKFAWQFPPPDTGHPGEDVQCFPGSVRIAPIGLQGSVAYRYVGKLIEIQLGEGVEITTTPNHPILTEAGWKAAGLIDEGDKLIVHRGSRALVPLAVDPDIRDRYPIAQELHRFLGGVGDLRGTVARRVDLHGHHARRDEQVDVVDVDGKLRDRYDAACRQLFADLGFECPDMRRLGSVLPTLRSEGHLVSAAPRIAGFPVGRCRKPFLFLEGHSRHADQVRFGTAAGGQSQFIKAQVDRCARLAEFLCHLKHRLAEGIAPLDFGVQRLALAGVSGVEGLIFNSKVSQAGLRHLVADSEFPADSPGRAAILDQPFDLRQEALSAFAPVEARRVIRRHHDGPVYSFETASGIIIANSIVTHNCRCVAVALVTQATRDRLDMAGAHSVATIGIE